MESEVGVVTSINKNKAMILFGRKSYCENCGACGVAADGKNMNMEVDFKDDYLNVGDSVVIDMDTKYFMMSPLVLYVVPLLFLVIGALVGYFVLSTFINMDSELLTAITALGMTAISFFIIRALEPAFKKWRKGKIHVRKV